MASVSINVQSGKQKKILISSGIMIFNKKISMVIILLEGLQELKRRRVLPRD